MSWDDTDRWRELYFCATNELNPELKLRLMEFAGRAIEMRLNALDGDVRNQRELKELRQAVCNLSEMRDWVIKEQSRPARPAKTA